MAVKTPLVMGNDGRPQQLQAVDTIVANTAALNVRNVTNGGASSMPIGSPVYISGADTVQLGRANAQATSRIIGLMADVATAAAAVGAVALDGPLIATTGQWDAVTGQTGGLTSGAVYFLDPATAGRITTTPPTSIGHSVVEVGTAFSSTVLEVEVTSPILL